MLLTKCRYCIYIYSLDIICLYSALFIYVLTIHISNCITMFVSLIVISCTSSFFMYFEGSVLLSMFCSYSEILSQSFLQRYFQSMLPVVEDWFCTVVAVWQPFWLLVWTFYMYRLQLNFLYVWKLVFCFLYYFIKCIVMLCLYNYLVCSFNPSGIFGLNSSINRGSLLNRQNLLRETKVICLTIPLVNDSYI